MAIEAGQALQAEFTANPYYNVWFQIDTALTLCCHVLRALINLVKTLMDLITAFALLTIPVLGWACIPLYVPRLVDEVAGLTLSLVTIAILPEIFLCRTLSTMIWGYEQNSDFDNGIEAHDEAMKLSMTF